MYRLVTLVLMFVAPLASTALELMWWPSTGSGAAAVVGRWFVFWAVGWRLLLAGVRQIVQPRFTAREIFSIESDDVLPLVTELGVANLAAGVVGILAFWRPDFVMPVALYGAIFYAVAGLRHMREHDRSINETWAMVSDLFVAAVLGATVAVRLAA